MIIKLTTQIRRVIIALTFFVFTLSPSVGEAKSKQPVDFVNPYMGNISHLLVPTFPTIHLPNSMLRVYPERSDFTSDKINGLPVITTNHRERSAFNIVPFTGDVDRLDISPLSYDLEVIKPYYYEVFLDDIDVMAKYAPSHQSAIYTLDYSGAGSTCVVVKTNNGELSYDDGTIYGYQKIGPYSTKVYLYLETKQKAVDFRKVENNDTEYYLLIFDQDVDQIDLKYGVSFIDIDQAKANLEREIPSYDLADVKSKGRDEWNHSLGQISVTGSDDEIKEVFYTSLYRTYERMICMSEDGRYYSPFDGKIHSDGGVPFYNDDWIWDTYRATHPLRVIIEPELESDIINSYIRMAEQMDDFWMPTFPEVVGDTRRMNSNHGVATVIDAVVKGVDDFDLEQAYLACRGAITEKTLAPWSGAKAGELEQFYKKEGYFPALKVGESEFVPEVSGGEKRQPVAVTLGTVYDEWCLGLIAEKLGRDDEAKYFKDRSLNYRKIYNSETKFFHPKDIDGNFIEPFDYTRSGGMGARDAYSENNGWVYRWDVPHNIADLVSLMGGKESFAHELERMYNQGLGDSKFSFYSQLPDHTGNVGQFSMANEPSLHIPYLYNYVGQPWRTQKRVRSLIKQWFRSDLMGVPGDEDGGGMSAFVVFSALGFYPVTVGLPMYVIGAPMFEEATIDIANGMTFIVKCHNYSPENKYIQSATLNGEVLNRSWFSHDEMLKGGELVFVMGRFPNKEWASDQGAIPPSFMMPAGF